MLNYLSRNFGPRLVPLLQVGYRGIVAIDSGSQTQLATMNDYMKTCRLQTWEAMKIYADHLKGKNKKIAFFSSTPQGGGVALMRHALVRFANILDVDLKWLVAFIRPELEQSLILCAGMSQSPNRAFFGLPRPYTTFCRYA